MNKNTKNLITILCLSLIILCNGCFASSNVINTTTYNNAGPGTSEALSQVSNTNKTIENKSSSNETIVNGNIINDDGTITHDGIRFKKGDYLGEFMLSGYCNCTKCSTGTGITYSGKPTRVNHTVGAKFKNIPLNTYLIVENTHGKNVLSYDGVYQVEDTGSGVRDNHLDIFQANHDLAALVTYYGRTYADVYLAIPVEE